MATFLRWCVRWPSFAVAAGALVLGREGAFDPPVAWSVALLFALAGYAAGIVQRGIESRRRKAVVPIGPPRLTIIPGLKPQRERMDRAA